MEVLYKPSFVREFKKLSIPIQDDILEKIDIFRNTPSHQSLKVHKLKGELTGLLSFSVNYRYRIVFEWKLPNKSVRLLAVGDHSVYQ